MEDETRDFLVKIIQTMSWVLIWMMANVFIGIYKGLGFFTTSPGWTNYCFYAFFLVSLGTLIWHLRKKWKF